jgi:uncharacterized membrane protein
MAQVNPSAIPVQPIAARPRLDFLDLLRGWIMVIMALDHVRDFFSHELFSFDPTNLEKTTFGFFFTRWITHFCAPVFCFLAGTGAFLSLTRGKSKHQVAYFLVTRGAWLVLLEVTVVGLSWTFNPATLVEPGGGVIWALGWSMIALAALIYLPLWALTTFAVVMIAGHNLLDPLVPAQFGRLSGLWNVLHEGGPFRILPKTTFFVAYPLVPWIGVMAAGFAFGTIVNRERRERQRMTLWLGVGVTVAFLLLRAANVYGDPEAWSPHARGALFTFLSFLNLQKYPPSLLYLLMTLGPALIVLAIFDRAGEPGRLQRPVLVFGRVPLFYYLLHLPLIHLLGLVHDGTVRGGIHQLAAVSAGLRDQPAGRLPRLATRDCVALSAVSLVREAETAPARCVVELFLAAGAVAQATLANAASSPTLPARYGRKQRHDGSHGIPAS